MAFETVRAQVIGSVMALIGVVYGFLFLVSLYGLFRMRQDFKRDYD